jgi:hypothetical protein
MALLTEYLDLVPSQNASKPNFVAVLTAALQPLVDAQNNAPYFDLDTAIGAQLDVIGKWVGLSRQVDVPISGVYFALDTPAVGFDQGVWFGPGASAAGVTSLDDGTYRILLRIKIAANSWDGTLAGANQVLAAIAGSGTFIFMQDNFNMSVTIGVAGVVPSALFVALIRQVAGFVRPATVNIASVAITSVVGAPLFGFDSVNSYISGFDVGAWGISS